MQNILYKKTFLKNYFLNPFALAILFHVAIFYSLIASNTISISKQIIKSTADFLNNNSNNISEVIFLKGNQKKQISKEFNSKNFQQKSIVQTEPQFDAKYLNNPAPIYPKTARQYGIQGKVLLVVIVKDNGAPLSVDIASSSGSEILDYAAIEAVRNWHFIPASKDGINVQASVIVPIEFKIV